MIRRIALTVLAMVSMTERGTAAMSATRFDETYWFADGVAVGRVVGEQDNTFDIQLESWARDRSEQHAQAIRAYRYSESTCVPGTGRVESYPSGSRYLFLLRQPYDAGGGDMPYWSVLGQFLLDGSPLCVSTPPEFRVDRPKDDCRPNVRETDLLDAVRTFEGCFELYDDRIIGTYPVKQTCSERQLRAWRKRSALHEGLAATAIKHMGEMRRGGA
jgi:hypothetical protein